MQLNRREQLERGAVMKPIDVDRVDVMHGEPSDELRELVESIPLSEICELHQDLIALQDEMINLTLEDLADRIRARILRALVG